MMSDLRSKQSEVLSTVYGLNFNSVDNVSSYPDFVFVSGRASSGKTFTVRAMLHNFNVVHHYFDCVCVFTFKDVLCEISRKVFGGNATVTEAQVVAGLAALTLPTLLVFDHCDQIIGQNSMLFNLSKLTNYKMKVLVISRCVPDFYYGSSCENPFLISFPAFTNKECEQILQLSCPNNVEADVFKTFVGLILGSMFYYCNNVKLLRRFVEDSFPIYIQPVHDEECSLGDWRKLWKLFEPKIKSNSTGNMFVSSSGRPNQAVELPFDSNYLLIAAYIASYNPPITDKKFFVKGKQPKSRAVVKKVNHILGPKPFPLDRLLAIFYSINNEEDVVKSQLSSLFAQLATLVNLKLLSSHGAEGIDSPKYVCLAKYEFACELSRKINFDLNSYLHDFV